ncbi:MAG: polysaccharide biosynthesis/export family protein [Terriglobales bacterium]
MPRKRPQPARASAIAARLALATVLAIAGAGRLEAQGASTMPVPVEPVMISPMPEPTAIPDKLIPDLAVPAAPDNYVIGDRDLLSVFVYQMPSMTRQVRVGSQGAILLPMLPRPITATGRTAPELEVAIRHDLLVNRLATNPVVQVVVRQVNSRPIVVSGEVRYPGVIQAAQPMSLLEVLSRAGGLNTDAGTQVLLTQASEQDPSTQTLEIRDIVAHATDPRWDPTLGGGESVRVLPARMIYAVGSFQKPGAFPLHSDEPITVLKAVALAQGFKDPASKSHAIIFRTDGGVAQPMPVNISKILNHQAPDITLEAGDILFVPENGWGKVLRGSAGVAGQAVALAIGYSFIPH